MTDEIFPTPLSERAFVDLKAMADYAEQRIKTFDMMRRLDFKCGTIKPDTDDKLNYWRFVGVKCREEMEKRIEFTFRDLIHG